jgi:hypothetical protein
VNVTTVASGCAWTPVAVPSWITVTNPGPGSGNGTFAYTVQPNTTAFVRNFTMMFGDLTHTITQGSFGDCNSNGINDATEITNNPALDCDGDNILNSCEIASGAKDCDLNGVPDDCQVTAPVRGWGAGSPGSSGPPNYGQSVPPTNLGAVKALAAGNYHSLAVQLNATTVTANHAPYGGGIAKPSVDASTSLTLNGSDVCGNTVWNINGSFTQGAAASHVCDCPGDVDGNGVINALDIAALLTVWNTDGGAYPRADGNHDGAVNALDVALLLSGWGACAP